MNTIPEAVAFLDDPNPAWANPDDCGDFPCTFPNNVFLKFTSSTGLSWSDFHIIHFQEGVRGGFDTRGEILLETDKAIFLDTTHLAVLQFESLDSDKRDRSSQPIWVNSTDSVDTPAFSNKLNAFMDHVWDGFYTGHLRL